MGMRRKVFGKWARAHVPQEGRTGWRQRERRKSMAFMQTMPFSVERGMGSRVMTVFGGNLGWGSRGARVNFHWVEICFHVAIGFSVK